MHLQQTRTLQELIHNIWSTDFYGKDHKLSTNLTTTRKFCEKVHDPCFLTKKYHKLLKNHSTT
jgi:hypothetical protein